MQQHKQQIPVSLKEMARKDFKEQGEDIGARLDKYEVPDEKFQAVLDYAIGMKAKNPLMKNDRIVRKAVQYFHLQPKVVEEENT